jgi:hypothetical protein
MPGLGGWYGNHAPVKLYGLNNENWDASIPTASILNIPGPSKPHENTVISQIPTHKPQNSALQTWAEFKTLLETAELQQIPILSAQLAKNLRKRSEPTLYQQINDLLANPDISLETKAILLDLLAEIATPDSLAQLINLAKNNSQSSLYILILQAISRIGDNRWDGQFHGELSPILEEAWINVEIADPEFLGAVGKAIATVGSSEGVEQLLKTVSGSTQGTEPEDITRIKQEVAFESIPKVRNPDAVDVLSTWLNKEPLQTPAFEVSGNALAEIGSAQATQKIVDWAKDAPSEAARNLQDWVSKIDNESALATITATQNQDIKSPEIADVLNTAATNIESSMAFSSTSAFGPTNTETSLLPLSDK